MTKQAVEEFLAALPAARLKALAARRGVEAQWNPRDELVQRVAVDYIVGADGWCPGWL